MKNISWNGNLLRRLAKDSGLTGAPARLIKAGGSEHYYLPGCKKVRKIINIYFNLDLNPLL